MLTLFIFLLTALAGTYTTTLTVPFPITDARPYPTTLFGGDRAHHLVHMCPIVGTSVEADGDAVEGCLASDVGTTTSPTDSRFTCENVLVDDADTDFNVDYLQVWVHFNSGVTTGNRSVFSGSFPSYIDCVKSVQPVSNPAHKHTIRVPLVQDDQTRARIVSVDATSYTWTQLASTGVTLSIPTGTAWPTGSAGVVYVNIPNGSYTGNSATQMANASTTVGGSTAKAGILCGVKSGAEDNSDDYAAVAILKGTVTTGVGYCKFNDGTTRTLKVTIN